jgi:RimJ/RimL family protein N-acetyltransferase
MSSMQNLIATEIEAARDADAVAAFLAASEWPFHASRTLSMEAARRVSLGPATEVRAFWLEHNRTRAGLLRVMDLQDAVDGSVLFDLRIAEAFRGLGLGRAAVGWLVETLFREYPALHRIEAATRIDNVAMRRVLEINHFVLEGRLRQTWRSDNNTRHDTALYGRLRSDGTS